MRFIQSFLFFISFLFAVTLSAQVPVKWSYDVKTAGNGLYDLVFTGKIDDGWYTYSQFLESEDGPIPTSFTFQEGPHFKLVGKAFEGGEKQTIYDKVFEMNLTKFKHLATFTQRVQVTDPTKPIKGYLTFIVCNDSECLPPKDKDFEFKIPSSASTPAGPSTPPPGGNEQPNNPIKSNDPKVTNTGIVVPGAEISTVTPVDTTGTTDPTAQSNPTATPPTMPPPNDENFKGFFDAKRTEINSNNYASNCSGVTEESKSYFWIFFWGFIGGLAALLTPCVFPMIPMTVTFFLKGSENRAQGIRNAIIYGLSIITIYTALGILATMIFGPTVLNEMSTDVWFNLLFFVVFVVFALSFFGLFEITIPSWLTNSSDKMADKGGLIGIFFMAFTLALVSFSCTGPIVGSLLVETAKSTSASDMFLGVIPAKPAVGLFGFGLALALPFALFAAFPTWLKSLPKSGGWMDNVKITLGFVELALALKFLSTADLVRHWGFLKIELFLGLWVILALLLALYQFGILGFKGAKGRPGPLRLLVGTIALVLTGYLGYGLFSYKSLSLLSGLAPPVGYSFFKPNDCPHSLDCYHDFDEALEVAKKQNKPLFVDFTGYGCVNCRKMEEQVWYKQGIIDQLRDNYVVVSLYVDDQARLFPDNKFDYLLDPNTGEKMRTKGDKWGAFQVNNFATSTQPYYVLMSNDGKTLLNKPVGYTPDVPTYQNFLECGFSTFKSLQSAQGNR